MGETIDLSTPPAGQHNADDTLRVVHALGELVRVLNHFTMPVEAARLGVPYPSTISDVVGGMATAAQRTPQLARQLADRLSRIAAERELYVSHGDYVADPDRAAGAALAALHDVAVVGEEMYVALRAAHSALAALGVRVDENDDE